MEQDQDRLNIISKTKGLKMHKGKASKVHDQYLREIRIEN